MSATDTYADLVKRVEDLENRKEPRLRSGRGNYWGDNFGLAAALNVPRASIWRAAALTLTSGVATSVGWDATEYDTDGMTGLARITCRTAGVYLCTAAIGFVNEAAGYRSIYFRKNSAGVYGIVSDTSPSALTYCEMVTTWLFPLNANDFIDVVITSSAVAAGRGIDPATLTNRVNGFTAVLVSTI